MSVLNSSEYIETLLEQIREKKAHPYIKKEIEAHIEDRTLSYEYEGISHEKAQKKAIDQMGDPIITGEQLNKIHAAKKPYDMLCIAFFLTVFGIVMQAIIFKEIDNLVVRNTYLLNTIIYNLLGFIIIALILFQDYTLFIKKIYWIYALYLIVFVLLNISQGGNYARARVISYYSCMIYPIIFTGFLYLVRKKGIRGILRITLLSFMTLAILLLTQNNICLSGVLEAIACCLIVLSVAILNGVMKGKKYQMLSIIWTPAIVIPSFILIDILGRGGRYFHLAEYQLIRIDAILHPSRYTDSSNYILTRMRNAVSNLTLSGNQELPFPAENTLFSDYVMTSIFSYFGIIIGSFILLLIGLFLLKGIRVTLEQKNEIGILLGTICCVSLAFRIIIYVISNLGIPFISAPSIPFLTYGLSSALINGIFIGILLSVYRNTNILGCSDEMNYNQ